MLSWRTTDAGRGGTPGGVVKLVNTAALEAVGPFRRKKISALASSSLVPAFTLYQRDVAPNMTIFAHPRPGTVLICDFQGFREPEMVKARPVVIVSPHYIRRTGLYAVVPLSSTPPDPICPYHYKFAESRVPGMPDAIWAKCDMVVSVAESRLDRVKVSRGNYQHGNIAPEELAAIKACIKYALGLT